jgi:multiple sugar transport system permease protein
MRSVRTQHVLRSTLIYAVLIAGAALMIFPFLWMLSTSFKSMGEVRAWPPSWIPEHLDLTNYRDIWNQYPMVRFLWNGFVIAGLTTLGTLISCSLAGFALAQLQFPGRALLFLVVLSTLLLPYQVRMVPLFIEMSRLGWIDTFKPLVVPAFFGSAYGIFLMRQFFMGIPKELKEAAILDGATPFGVFWSIFLPLSKPALTALGIVAFVTSWNDLLAPMIFITTFEKMPIALALAFFKGQGEALWPWLMAASVISMLPLMVVYLAAQRWFIEGMTFTGLKQ